MLADCGASAVIVGHSERRADHGETDATIAAKAKAAWDEGLLAVICIGESLAQRDAGETLDLIAAQLAGSLPDTPPAPIPWSPMNRSGHRHRPRPDP